MQTGFPGKPGWPLALVVLAAVVASEGCSKKEAPAPAPSQPVAAPGSAPAGSSRPSGPVAAATSVRLARIPKGADLGGAVFSADGKHVALVVAEGDRAAVVRDGKRGKSYDAIRALVFHSGGRLAFVARSGGVERVVVDGVEGASFDTVGTVRFAPDGRVVYPASRKGEWRVVVGEREGPVSGKDEPSPLVSADGGRLVYVEQSAGTGKSRLRACSLDWNDCLAGDVFDAIYLPTMDASGVRVAYAVARDGKQTVATAVLKGDFQEKPGIWFDAVNFLALSGGGEHVAFVARRGEEMRLVRDGDELPLPSGINLLLGLVVAKNGRVLCTGMMGQEVFAFVDGKRVGKGYEEIDDPIISLDGAHYAFVAGQQGRNLVVLDGRDGPVFDKIVSPRFSPDGTRVVYRARQDGQRFIVVADTTDGKFREHPRHEAVFDVVFPDGGSTVAYGVGEKQQFSWKVEPL